MTETIPIYKQKQAVIRAHEILKEIYPARIGAKRATQSGADTHLMWLDAALATLDKLEHGEDARPDLAKGTEA